MTLSIIGTPTHMGVQPTFSTTRACAFALPLENIFDYWVDASLASYNPGGKRERTAI